MCNSQIHDELKNMEENSCPFCFQLLVEGDNITEPCCFDQNMGNKNGMNVCLSCGSVHSCHYANEYVDFYHNMHRIYRKSVYHRKYHIENTLNDLCIRNNIVLTHNQRDQIYKVFDEIGEILHLVNGTRKRMISVNFIMRRIFKMMGIPYKKIPISKSKKTISFYNKYWTCIISHIGGRIDSIIG